MSTYKSFFNPIFFIPVNRQINTLFIATNTFEQYIVEFTNEDVSLLSKKEELYSTWTSFFNPQQENHKINLLCTKVSLFIASTVDLKSIQKTNREDIIKRYLLEYQELTEYHPFFLMFYKQVYTIISGLLNETNTHFADIELFCKQLNDFMDNYIDLFTYVKNVLVEPFQYGLEYGTGYCVIRYECMLTANQLNSPLFPARPLQGSTWTNELGSMVTETICSNIDINEYNASFICRNDLDFSREFARGIQYYIDNDFILRQCPQCKGYFKTKRNLMVSYCSRIYRNNLTCQDISAKNKYKEKMTSHPIHSEYTKMYNKIYAKIRRKTLNKENAKLKELKDLHEYYYQKYENNSPILRDGILQEFINEINNLYK